MRRLLLSTIILTVLTTGLRAQDGSGRDIPAEISAYAG